MVMLTYVRLLYELIIIDDDNGGYNMITQWLIVIIKLLAVGGKLFSLRIGGGIYYYCYLLIHLACDMYNTPLHFLTGLLHKRGD